MPQLIIVFLVVAAIRGLAEQTKRDLAKWRGRPAPSRRRGSGGRFAAWWRRHVTAGSAGYWGHQAAHGFPTARNELHDGWTRGREAHHRARRAIARNQAEHAEGRAELEPELAEYRRRRDEALAEITRQREIDHAWAEAELEDRWREDHPEPAVGQCLHQGTDCMSPAHCPCSCGQCLDDSDEDAPVDVKPEPEAGPGMCAAHSEPLPCWLCDWPPPELDQIADDDLTSTSDLPESDLTDEEVFAGAPQPEPEEGSQYDQEAGAIRDGFEYEDCWLCGQGLEGHDIVPDPLGHAHAICKTGLEDQDPPQPEEAPAPQGNQGEETMTETTYQGVKARMAAAVSAAEQMRSDAEQSQALTEEHLEQACQAKNWASATADEMQAMGVDAGSLGAMADHLSALDEAETAASELHEQMGQVKDAWAKVEESAQAVTAALDAGGHGGLDEAHANAAGGGAEKAFYGEG